MLTSVQVVVDVDAYLPSGSLVCVVGSISYFRIPPTVYMIIVKKLFTMTVSDPQFWIFKRITNKIKFIN